MRLKKLQRQIMLYKNIPAKTDSKQIKPQKETCKEWLEKDIQ